MVPENNDVQNNVLGQKRKEQRDEYGQENEESSSGNNWQHVVRKKVDWNDPNKALNKEKICNVAGEGTKGMEPENNNVQNKVCGRKRKEQSADNGQENEEPSSGNKRRLVWTAELHRHFVAAINQLGLDKASPKRILALMNVEGVTKAHVASHLQKYKLKLSGQFCRRGASNLSESTSESQSSDLLAISSTSESQSSDFLAISSTSAEVSPLHDAIEMQCPEPEDLLWESIDFNLDGLLDNDYFQSLFDQNASLETVH